MGNWKRRNNKGISMKNQGGKSNLRLGFLQLGKNSHVVQKCKQENHFTKHQKSIEDRLKKKYGKITKTKLENTESMI